MKKEVLSKLKKEVIILGALYILILIALKIIFFKERFVVVISTTSSLFWIFFLPGYFILFYLHEKLSFPERLIIGIGVSTALMGILSYHLGIFGLHIKNHTIILPALIIIIGLILAFIEKKDK